MEELVYIRDQLVEGVGPWVWPTFDTGAWIGPSEEFAGIRDAMMPHIKNRKVIVQAGGCCGMYPRLWAEIFETVYTFEPAPLNWYCLNRNCPTDNIKKYNAALGEYEQTVFLQLGEPTNVGTNTIHYEDGVSIPVDLMRLDGLNLPFCDAIQLDIEGYEPAALMGAEATIAKFRPVISLETRNSEDASHIILGSWGYKVLTTVRNETIFVPI